jgi:hypothetical protein
MAVRGGTLRVKGIGDYTVDAGGHYTVRYNTFITESAPGARKPSICNNRVVFETVFTGTCMEDGTGRGYIAPGGTGRNDFWEEETQGDWCGHAGTQFEVTALTDTLNPAVPGVYDTREFLALFGVKASAGVTVKVVLTRAQ